MKKIFLLFLYVIPFFSLQAMIINNVTVSPINTQDINVHLKVSEAAVFYFTNSDYSITGNTITLTACYILGLQQAVTTLQSDVIINDINLNSNNYNLVVVVNYKNNQNVCIPGIFSDTKTLNFSTPLTNPVSLSSNQFKNPFYQLSPNPTTDDLKIVFGAIHQKIKITLQNTMGQIISSKTFSNLDAVNYSIEGESGIYLLTIEDENGENKTQKIIKK